jgi:hypothetical protein
MAKGMEGMDVGKGKDKTPGLPWGGEYVMDHDRLKTLVHFQSTGTNNDHQKSTYHAGTEKQKGTNALQQHKRGWHECRHFLCKSLELLHGCAAVLFLIQQVYPTALPLLYKHMQCSQSVTDQKEQDSPRSCCHHHTSHRH